MDISFCFICAVALLSKVSMQAQFDGVVEGVTGGFVILPCPTNSTDELKTEDITVHWRHKDVKIVYDIIKGQYSGSYQDPKYKSRAETFPDEYKKGNFSLKLTNLTRTDGGEYTCFKSHLSEHMTIQLIIANESKAHNEKQSTAHKKQQPTAENEKKKEETRTKWIIISVFCAFMFCVFAICALKLRKKCAKTSGSAISVPGGLSCGV